MKSGSVIKLVVGTLAAVAVIGVLALSYCLVSGHYPDERMLVAYVGIVTGAIASMSGFLTNIRPNTSDPVATTVVNSEEKPVHTQSQDAPKPAKKPTLSK